MKLSAIATALCLPLLSYGAALAQPPSDKCVTEDDVDCWYKQIVQNLLIACHEPAPPICEEPQRLRRRVAQEEEPAPPEETGEPCECDEVVCLEMWPDSCYCHNNAKIDCWYKCGGEQPELQKCPPREE